MGRSDCLLAYQLAPARWIEVPTLSASSLLGGEGGEEATIRPCITILPRNRAICTPSRAQLGGRPCERTRAPSSGTAASSRRELHRETRRKPEGRDEPSTAGGREPPPGTGAAPPARPTPLVIIYLPPMSSGYTMSRRDVSCLLLEMIQSSRGEKGCRVSRSFPEKKTERQETKCIPPHVA
jgi:hypothetical protein